MVPHLGVLKYLAVVPVTVLQAHKVLQVFKDQVVPLATQDQLELRVLQDSKAAQAVLVPLAVQVLLESQVQQV
jgi:hypothetical protein